MANGEDGSKRSDDTICCFCDDFGAALRAEGASLRRVANLSGWGKSTIATATRGPALPNIELVADVLVVLQKTPLEIDNWRQRHRALLAEQKKSQYKRSAGAEPCRADIEEREGGNGRTRVKRQHPKLMQSGRIALAVFGVALVAAFVVIELQPMTRTIIVQNKVAFGPTSLVEDRSPSYLGARPVAYCANQRGCKLDGTEVGSGAALKATCQLQGDLVTNADLRTTKLRENPNVDASSLWYGVRWPDGRIGYISEVYIAPQYRGGLELPAC